MIIKMKYHYIYIYFLIFLYRLGFKNILLNLDKNSIFFFWNMKKTSPSLMIIFYAYFIFIFFKDSHMDVIIYLNYFK